MAEDYELIKKAVTEAMHDEMKDFYVDREKHYEHHKFIDDWICWSKSGKATFVKVLFGTCATAITVLLLYGFLAWVGKAVK